MISGICMAFCQNEVRCLFTGGFSKASSINLLQEVISHFTEMSVVAFKYDFQCQNVSFTFLRKSVILCFFSYFHQNWFLCAPVILHIMEWQFSSIYWKVNISTYIFSWFSALVNNSF